MTSYKIALDVPGEISSVGSLPRGRYLVTGATGTYGQRVVHLLASRCDLDVVAVARDETKLKGIVANFNQKILTGVCSSRNKSDLENIFRMHGPFTGIIHCEGSYGHIGPISTTRSEDWIDSTIEPIISVLNLLKTALDNQANDESTSIIVLGGGGASSPYVSLSSYSVAKTGIVRLVENFALEMGEKNSRISVNVLGPGPAYSQMVVDVLSSQEDIDQRIIETSIILNKSKNDVDHSFENAVLYLLSTEGRQVTGRFLSAKWDEFSQIINNIEDLNAYTLRRVIPE
jgi:short-subunit dehydrogenase